MNESCSRYLEWMSGFVDGELPEADVRALETHLAGCAECRLALDQLRANDEGLRAALAHESTTREETEALQRALTRLEGEPAPEWERARRRSRRNWSVTLRWSAGLAAAAAAILLFMRLGPAPTAPIRSRTIAPSHEVAVPAPAAESPVRSAETTSPKTVTTQSAPTSSPERPAGAAPRDEAATGSATDRMKGEAPPTRKVERVAAEAVEPESPAPAQATGPAASAPATESQVAIADQGVTGPNDAEAGRTGVGPTDAPTNQAETGPSDEAGQAATGPSDAAKAERADPDAAARAEEKDRPSSAPRESELRDQASNAPAPERPGTSAARESRGARSGRVAPTEERSPKSAPPPAGSSSLVPSKSKLSGGTTHSLDGKSSAYYSRSGAPSVWYMTIAETDTIVADLAWKSRLQDAEVELASRTGAVLPADERARRYRAIGDLWEWFGRRNVDPFASMHAVKCYTLAVKNDPEAAALDSTRVQRARTAVFGTQKVKPAYR